MEDSSQESEDRSQKTDDRSQNADELRSAIREVLGEFIEGQKRTESLEQRVNELIAENAKSRAAADEAQRSASIRGELQRLGVSKIDLAYKAVKDDVRGIAESDLRGYIENFVGENPELLPARLAGGSGASGGQRSPAAEGIDLDRIRPGMNPEEKDRIRREVARVASKTLRGWNG